MKIKAVIFDLDGTLLNTLNSINHFLCKTLGEYGFGEVTLEQTKYFVGEGAVRLVVRALEHQGYDVSKNEKKLKDITARYVSDYNNNPKHLTTPYKGIPKLISELLKRGYKLGVVSNKPDPTVKSLVKDFFGDSFGFVLGGREGIKLKPSADMPLMACHELSVLPSEVMYVGDTSTDMKTGKAFGAGITVGVSWGFRDSDELWANGAEEVVDEPCRILELLES